MRKQLEWKWEQLDNYNNGASISSRSKVIGGWIVHHAFTTRKGVMSESMVFIPDRDHEWHILAPVQYDESAPSVKANSFEPK